MQEVVSETSTVDLVRAALDEGRELARLEVRIAKRELELEIARAKSAAIIFAVAIAAAVPFLSLLGVAIVIAAGTTVTAALAVSAVFLVASGIAAWVGWFTLPKKPLERTIHRVKNDVAELKEHIA